MGTPSPFPGQAFAHPTLALPLTDEQRDRSVDYLQHAYAQGRLAKYEFDERLHLVLVATNRAELNQAFVGLANIPVVPVARKPLLDTSAQGRTGRTMAAVAHWSALATWVLGPAVVYAVSPARSFARKEAAKAVNLQLLFLLLSVAAMLAPEFLEGYLMFVVALGWLGSTVVGGLKAHRGIAWRNPVQRVLPLQVAREDGAKGQHPSTPALRR